MGSPPPATNIDSLLAASAAKYGHDPELLRRQAMAESKLNPNAVSPAGAAGVLQIMPDTARDPGFGVTPISDQDRFDAAKNIDFGANYMAQLRKRYNGDDRAALVAYNWGPGNADAWVSNGSRFEDLPPETQQYVSRILDGYTPNAGGAGKAKSKAAPSFAKAIAARAAAAAATNHPVDPSAAAPAESAVAGPAEAPVTARPKETASASAVVVPAVMQAPPTPKEQAAINGYPADVQLFMLAKSRGLDDNQAAAFADSVTADNAAAAQRTYGEMTPGERMLKDDKGRLATLIGAATLGFGDDVVGLVAPETAEAMRTERADYARENPLSAAIVSLMGGAVFTGALNAGLKGVGAANIPVASSAARGLTAFETAAGLGPKLRNALRVGGQGAILGGIDAAGNGSNVVGGAILGGAAGTLLGPAAEAVIKGGRALLSSPASKAIRALAARLGETPQKLSRRWAHFEAITGRPPSIAEIADGELAQELASLGKMKKGAETILVDAERAADRARPQRLADEITGDAIPAPRRREGVGGRVPNVGDEVVAQRTRMDDEMVRIGGTPVAVNGDEFQRFMGSPEIQRAARNDPNLRRAMARAADDFSAAADNPDLLGEMVTDAFTVRDLEGLRQLLRAEQARAVEGGLGNIGDQYRRMSEDIIDLVSAEVPRYGAALRRFGEDSRRITGIKEGKAGRTAEDATTVDLRRDLTTAEGRAGNVEGLRGRLVDEATASERGAVSTARKLTEDNAEMDTLREAFGRDEAKRLRRVGEVETRAAENMAVAARGNAPTERQSLMNIAAQTAEGIGLMGTQATRWFKIRTATRWLRNVSVSADKAKRIALLATIPGRSRNTINALIEEGLTERQIREFFNQYGAAGAVSLNETTTKKRRRRVADE